MEAGGSPLSVVLAGANVRDDKLLAATLDAVVVEQRPIPTEEAPQHLCLDKGYDNHPIRRLVEERNYVAHIRHIGEEKKDHAGEERYPARRWVVERTLGWLSKCRGILLVRYEKKAANYLGLSSGLHPALVPAPAPSVPFEIVSYVTAALRTTSLSDLVLGAFRRILSIFVTLSLLNKRASCSIQQVVPLSAAVRVILQL